MSVRAFVTNRRKPVLASGAAARLAGAVVYFLGGRIFAGRAQADDAANTKSVAAAAGARALPTDPKLNVERDSPCDPTCL